MACARRAIPQSLCSQYVCAGWLEKPHGAFYAADEKPNHVAAVVISPTVETAPRGRRSPRSSCKAGNITSAQGFREIPFGPKSTDLDFRIWIWRGLSTTR